jgi:hypothetical protein
MAGYSPTGNLADFQEHGHSNLVRNAETPNLENIYLKRKIADHRKTLEDLLLKVQELSFTISLALKNTEVR